MRVLLDGYILMCSNSVNQKSCSCVVDDIAREKLRQTTTIFEQTTQRQTDAVGNRQ